MLIKVCLGHYFTGTVILLFLLNVIRSCVLSIQIKSGVRQGNFLSPSIFKSAIADVLDGLLPTSFLNGVEITYLAYSDGVLLISKTHEALQSNLDRLLHGFSKIDLRINSLEC